MGGDTRDKEEVKDSSLNDKKNGALVVCGHFRMAQEAMSTTFPLGL